ncbi:SMI1/KNR4 family protein [Leucobacter viscericola]|uniref:SMI1/KNR4 family protein n=1 Tax=Leucobacter viscericola TaxID=2714935 RepID=UPI001981BD4E|nr:SMI1/KNR4 family protein [Leucobacter viscericola]
MNEVVWQFADRDVTLEEIAAIQQELGVELPSDYVTCIRKNNGASAEPDLFELETGEQKVFGTLLSFDRESEEFVLDVFNDHKAALPAGAIPIAFDPAGNLICFDYGGDDANPAVVFWNHENAGDKDILMSELGLTATQADAMVRKKLTRIASTFTAFVEGLHG